MATRMRAGRIIATAAAATLVATSVPGAAHAADPMCAKSTHVNQWLGAGDYMSVGFYGSFYITSISFNSDHENVWNEGIVASGRQVSSPTAMEWVNLYNATSSTQLAYGWAQILYKC